MKGRGNLNLKRGSLVLVSTTAPGGSSPRRGGGGVRSAGGKPQGEEVFASPRPHPLGLPALKVENTIGKSRRERV